MRQARISHAGIAQRWSGDLASINERLSSRSLARLDSELVRLTLVAFRSRIER